MLLRAGMLVDGTGGQPQYDCYIAVDGDNITAVGRETDFSSALVGQALDYSAYCLLPGLIDSHVHLFLEGIADPKERQGRWKENRDITLLRAAQNLGLTIRQGVTTVRDLAGPHGIGLALKQAVNANVLSGPGILTCNQGISVTGGHFHYAGGREADGALEIAQAVREQVQAGADCIKLMLTGCVNFQTEDAGAVELSETELTAAVAEAERHNRLVSVHANGIAGVRQALSAGVRTIEHGALLDEATTDLLSSSQTYWTPTLTPFFQMLNYSKQYVSSSLPTAGLERVYSKHCAMLRRAIAAGAKIIAGTDAGSQGVQHGDLWQELALLAQLGMAPLQAIASATGLAAKAAGISNDIGSIAAGQKADLLVIEGNPLDDIQCLRNVVQVYKKGIAIY